MSRDIAYRPEKFHLYKRKASIPILGITEEIDFEKLQHPKQIYKHAKLCVLRLQKEYPALKTVIFSNEEDPLTGLQNIMQLCREAASDNAGEKEQNATPKEESLVWKLYEKTLKAILAAVLEWWRNQLK